MKPVDPTSGLRASESKTPRLNMLGISGEASIYFTSLWVQGKVYGTLNKVPVPDGA